MRWARGSGADGWGRSDFIRAHKTSSSAAGCSSNKRLFIMALPLLQRFTQRHTSALSQLFYLSWTLLSLKLRVRAGVFSTYFRSIFSSIKASFFSFFFLFLKACTYFRHPLALLRRHNYFPALAGVGFPSPPHLCAHLIYTQCVQELHFRRRTLNHLRRCAKQGLKGEKKINYKERRSGRSTLFYISANLRLAFA